FFMVRVAALRHAVSAEEDPPDLSGGTPRQQLTAVSERAHAMVDALYKLTTGEIMPALAAAGVRIVSWSDLDPGRRVALGDYFREAVLPILTPLAIDASRAFPLLSSLSLNLALQLDAAPGETDRRLAIVQVPPGPTPLGVGRGR